MSRVLSVVLLAGLVACNSGGGGVVPQPNITFAYSSLGELDRAIEDALASPDPATRLDSDGDGIPDWIERKLGLDPFNVDSDRDGLVDGYELFGASFDPRAPLPDADRDGLIASADVDDDNDFVNDGEVVDTDGDGVPNYLEFYGYTYDFLTGRFKVWNGNPNVRHFFTDPLQPSTDQDAYPDGMEASGALLDPTVRPPGKHPLVPATPNIVFELVGYTVTLNEQIQLTQSESIESGRSWTRQTETTHSHTNQFNWEVSGEYDFGPNGGAKVGAKVGGTHSGTNSVAVSVASGISVTTNQGWSLARSSNPVSAAQMKLYLKVHNRGTAPLSNLAPTLVLRIGGLSVATFKPGNGVVAMLVPGGSYPAETGVHWVVDSVSTGGGAAPLSLTMSELRALERGAPVSIALAQQNGDVMRLAPGGVWERIGDTNEYTARCEAVCANIRIELGDGQLIQHLVYAGTGPSEPRMTFGDALPLLGVDGDLVLSYVNRDGVPATTSLGAFTFVFDDATLRANGWSLRADGAAETTAPDGFEMTDMRLFPETTLLIRAPRDPQANGEPIVHFAYFDPFTGEVRVSASDYEGISSVIVRNEDASRTLTLVEEIPGAGFYVGSVNEESGFDAKDLLTAIVTNLAGEDVEAELGQLFVRPDPQPPVIEAISLDKPNRTLYARVASGNPGDPLSDVRWVKAFHPGFTATGGVLEMKSVVNAFEDPDGYAVDLPVAFTSTDVRIVGFVANGVWTDDVVSPEDVIDPYRLGTATLHGETKESTGLLTIPFLPVVDNFVTWWRPWADFDAPAGGTFTARPRVTHLIGVQPSPHGASIDMWVHVTSYTRTAPALLRFNAHHRKLDATAEFGTLKKDDIIQAQPASKADLPIDSDDGIREGDILAVKSSDNRYAKVKITKIELSWEFFRLSRNAKVTFQYVVFK